MPVSERALREVQAEVERDMDRRGIHTVYRGFKKVGGVETDEPAVVAVVGSKLSTHKLREQGIEPLPPAFEVGEGPNAERVPVDVVEGPQPRRLLLMLPASEVDAEIEAFRGSLYQSAAHQRCFDAPVPCGVQIAPQRAGWVGTMGGPFSWVNAMGDREFGALTNYHVAHGGQYPKGHAICQPHGQGPRLGELYDFCPIDFRGGDNRIDAALVRARTVEGVDLVGRDLFQVGTCGTDPVAEPQLGTRVVKTGRTTGVRHGRIVGVGATSHVNYGPEGTAKFVDQCIIRADGGEFSGPHGDHRLLVVVVVRLGELRDAAHRLRTGHVRAGRRLDQEIHRRGCLHLAHHHDEGNSVRLPTLCRSSDPKLVSSPSSSSRTLT